MLLFYIEYTHTHTKPQTKRLALVFAVHKSNNQQKYDGIFQRERNEKHSADGAGGAAGKRLGPQAGKKEFPKKKSVPVSVEEVKVRFWSETSGACTSHSVQRWLQVAAPPKHGSRHHPSMAGQGGKKRCGKGQFWI